MPSDRLDRDDVQHALDALASEVPAPTADARSLIARGRRRILRQRLTVVGIALVVIAAAATVGAAANNHDNSRRVIAPTTTTTGADTTTTTTATTPKASTQVVPAQLAFPAGAEGWICGDRVSYSTSDFDPYATDGGTKQPVIPPNPSAVRGDVPQEPLCAAAPGGNFWLVRGSANESLSEIVHVTIRPTGDETSVSPFVSSPFGRIEAIDFVDATHGWALVAHLGADIRTLYATEDGGVNWSEMDQDTQIRSTLAFADTRHGWSVSNTDPTKLATTSDGGRTWHEVDAHVPLAADPPHQTIVSRVFVQGDAIVAYGRIWTENTFILVIVVSTDGGRTWEIRSGPKDVLLSGSSDFDAADADHWAIGTSNRLYVTDNGGRTWTDQEQFAGLDSIVDVARPSANAMFVSGYGDGSQKSAVVLGTINGGENWTTVDFSTPPRVGSGQAVNWAGGIVGCPTRTITPAEPGSPPPGLVDAAFAYIGGDGLTASAVYKVGDTTTGVFGDLFKYQLHSCPPESVANSWVVELHGKTGSGGGGSTPRAEVALAHYADGWHVFGRYH